MAETITVAKQITLVTTECGSCGIPFAMPQSLWDSCYEQGGYFHCPNGHRRGWEHGARHEKLRAAEEKIVALQAQIDREQSARWHAERAAMDQAKEMKRRDRRSKAGVCQECHRTFTNYARHMETQHK